jgi:hypothetical protein
MMRALTLAAALLGAASMLSPAAAQQRATVEDFSVHLFMTETGKFSPDIFGLQELAVFNGSAVGKDFEGGKFEGYVISLRFSAPGEVFAQGPQARVILRTRKGKTAKNFTVSGLYVSDSKVAYHPLFITGLDCEPVEIIVTSHGKRIAKELPFMCGE